MVCWARQNSRSRGHKTNPPIPLASQGWTQNQPPQSHSYVGVQGYERAWEIYVLVVALSFSWWSFLCYSPFASHFQVVLPDVPPHLDKKTWNPCHLIFASPKNPCRPYLRTSKEIEVVVIAGTTRTCIKNLERPRALVIHTMPLSKGKF